ncbi:MAG: hypothetical protein ACR2RV_24875 [Verrucomicrobiales bacterium]
MNSTLLAAVLVGGCFPSASSGESIWLEGEAPARSDVQRHGWYDSVKKEVLSGGEWLSHYGGQPGEASYEFEVSAAGRFTIWARLNPVASKPSWRIDDEEWEGVETKGGRGQQNIAVDNKPDHRFIAWLNLGEKELAAGRHQIAFRWEGGASNSGGLDCLVLTGDPFVPQGTMKPGEAAAEAGRADWFPLLADNDRFDPASVIDMSSLVPAPAGELGFLKAVGDELRFEKSDRAVKLWGCGANVQPGRYTREELTQRARYLRKFGVNVVRQHAVFDELQTDGRIDPKKLDEYDWWFAELKKNGIYSDWSVFYHWRIRRDSGYALFDDLEGGGDLRDTYGVITVSPELWSLRNQVLVGLLQHRNPYTGMRYADDPALAVVEMQNEDSVFFWNPLGDLADPNPKRWPAHAKRLRERFADWVRREYRSDAELKAAWGELKHGDSVKSDELRVMSPWELDGPGPRGAFAGQTGRAGDCIRFLAELQRAVFEDCEKEIRRAGFRGVTVTTAWQVGGAATDPANIWTDCAGDMIDRHNYYGGGAGGHGITEGKVNNASHLAQPGGGLFSISMKQVGTKPFSVTEWTQSAPNQWKVEAAPLMAFYGLGLQGWDASFHFIQSGTRLGDGWNGMSSYASDTPAYIGQFPALAFALHRGHIGESAPAVARHLSKADLFAGTDGLKQDATRGGYDAKTTVVEGGTPLEAFAIGRVTVDFAGGETEQVELAKYWDQSARRIRSTTGELTWDYGRQLVKVETPKTQALIGRPGRDEIQLPDVAVEFRTPFISTIFTPLDDLPLAQSRRILITALAQDKQSGSRYSPDGARLEAVGTAPLLLEPVQATIRIRGARPKSVTPCDHYGVPIPDVTVPVAEDGRFEIDGRFRAYYYEVKR